MNDQQLLRYSRRILLDEFGIEGQQRLLASRVLIVGVGGLGSPAALYLASSGVGRITLCDHDTVDLSNLQRQIIHRMSTIGRPKVDSARSALQDINPDVDYVTLAERIDAARLRELVADADVVLDCSDNFPTRYAVESRLRRAAHAAGLRRGDHDAAQVAVFDLRRDDVPCYNCLFSEDSEAPQLRCATAGVLAPLVGVVGSIQAAEAIKLLAGIERGLGNKLLFIDALDMNFLRSETSKDPGCCVCGALRRQGTRKLPAQTSRENKP